MSDDHDKTETRDPPTAEADDETRLIQLRIAPETERQIADLQPAVSAWARDNGLAERTAEGDVIALAVELMHQRTRFSRRWRTF